MIDVKRLRLEKRVTKEHLARDLNVSIGTVTNWETGRCEPSASKAVEIAKYFGKTVEEIVK